MAKRRDPEEEWATETFGLVEFSDQRLEKRLAVVAGALAKAAGSSVLRACDGDAAKSEGAYRFLRNDRVKAAAIADAGFRSSAKRAAVATTVIATEDSTTLGFFHSASAELGDLGGPHDGAARGFIVHNVLLIDGDTGGTIGLVEQQRWMRDAELRGQRHKRRERSYEEKESFKWQRASLNIRKRLGDEVMAKTVSVCDREADVYEYMTYKVEHDERFVVRASWNRALQPDSDGATSYLREHVATAEIQGVATIKIPQRGGRAARSADLTVRSCAVDLRRPRHQSSKLPALLAMNVVFAREDNAPDGVEPLDWLLFTKEPVTDGDDIARVLWFYGLRWRVEEFHKAWKSGTRVEQRRLQTADNLERLSVILAFVAVRLLQLREQLETSPDAPCDGVLTREEWQVLWAAVEKKPPPKRTPSANWAYLAIGRLAGWIDTKRTGRIGWDTFWRGWSKLEDRVEGYRTALLVGRRRK
jgi:hypothetical protein